jgi:hypothetical protein
LVSVENPLNDFDANADHSDVHRQNPKKDFSRLIGPEPEPGAQAANELMKKDDEHVDDEPPTDHVIFVQHDLFHELILKYILY